MVVELLGVGWFALLVFGLFWKYAALPDLNWKFFQVGFMLFFLGVFVGQLDAALVSFNVAIPLAMLVGLFNLLGALAVVVATLQNLITSFSAK